MQKDSFQQIILKFVISIIIFLLCSSSVNAQSLSDLVEVDIAKRDFNINTSKKIPTFPKSEDNPYGYVIDQIQNTTNNHRYSAANWYLAQSFKPSKNPLAKIELLLEINANKSNQFQLEIAIRHNLSLNQPPLAQKKVTFTNMSYNQIWLEIEYEDIMVTRNEPYYITIHQIGSGSCYWYGNYDYDYYTRGYAYGFNIKENRWENLSNMPFFKYFDFCFKTFSYGNNLAPQLTKISGPILGETQLTHSYTFLTHDPEQNKIYLTVDWGDERTTRWLGPFQSDEKITLNHTWSEKGIYTIKAQAKDIAGNIGDWTRLKIIMPKDTAYTSFIQYIYKFLNIFV